MPGDWRSDTTNSDAEFFVIEGDPAGADRSEMASESSRIYERPAGKRFNRPFAKNTLKHLPSEAPALLAFPYALFPYALSEIDNVSGPINEHESKRDQGINTADAEAGEEKLEGVPICIAPMLTR